jgi:hypothetical protein
LRHGSLPTPFDGIPINILERHLFPIKALIDAVIAANGSIPLGGLATRVELGYAWIGTVDIYIGASLAGLDLASNLHAQSEIPDLELDYTEAGVDNLKIPLLPDAHYQPLDWNKGFDLTPAVEASIKWTIGEATEDQQVIITDYDKLSEIYLNTLLMPAKPNVFGLQGASPHFKLCLMGFDYDVPYTCNITSFPTTEDYTSSPDGGLCWSGGAYNGAAVISDGGHDLVRFVTGSFVAGDTFRITCAINWSTAGGGGTLDYVGVYCDFRNGTSDSGYVGGADQPLLGNFNGHPEVSGSHTFVATITAAASADHIIINPKMNVLSPSGERLISLSSFEIEKL